MLEPCISQVPSTFFRAQPWLITQLVIYITERKRTYPFHQLVIDTEDQGIVDNRHWNNMLIQDE